MEPDEQVNWPLPQHGEAPPRPARETLASVAEQIAARPVRNRLEGAARQRPAEPRGEPRGEPRPEARAEPRRLQIQPDPQAVAAADQNLAAMAHRLEAALRMPKMVADARGEGGAPQHVAPPAPAPENGVDAAAAEAAKPLR